MEMKPLRYCWIAIMILLYFLSGAWAQQITCISQLLPCFNIINTSHNPPDSCCEPLRNVIKDMPECLCSMMSTGGAFVAELVGINVTEVQQLPERCGEHVNLLGCLSGTPDSNTDVPNYAGHSFGSTSIFMAIALLLTLQVLWGL